MEHIKSQIIKIIGEVKECESKYSDKPNYYFKVKLQDGNKYDGFSYHPPFENDYIEGIVNFKKSNNDTYKFDKTVDLKLPINKDEQLDRIIKVIVDYREIAINDNEINEIINFYSSFKFGEEYWFYIYKYYIESNNIEDYKLAYYIEIVCEHISKYYDSMIKPFVNLLKEKGVTRLTKNQALSLYLNPKLGYNINNWKCCDLEILMGIDGFGIKTIIKLAYSIGGTIDDITRLLILYSINYNHNGNTYLKYDYIKLKKEIYSDYDISDYLFDKDNLNESNQIDDKLNKDNFNNTIQSLINENRIININSLLYGKYVFETEMNISETLVNFNNNPNIISKTKITEKNILKEIKSFEQFTLNTEQIDGILNIFKNNVSVIYGKAGTGKTTLLKGFIETYATINKQIKSSIYFLTPTGKAKMRTIDVLGELSKYIDEFMTIHAFNFRFGNEHNINKKGFKLDQDKRHIFVIDETSMIDIYLLNNLLNIIKNMNISIVFLGDIRQLPSIGPGCILEKIIKSKIFASTELIQVVRNHGNIIKILDKVSDGIKLTIDDCDDKKEFTWIQSNGGNENKILKDILNSNYKSDIIITTNNAFISELTDDVRNIKNPLNNKKELIKNINEDTKIIYRVGDPVIHCKNDNEKKLANGMQGKIIDIIDNLIHVLYENNEDNNKNRTVIYDKIMLQDLKPAYLISAHKSQGQEYTNIIVILKNSRLLNRNVLYTGLSRAKKSILLISSEKVLDKCIGNKIKRNSLMDIMIEYFNTKSIIDFIDYYNQANQTIINQANQDTITELYTEIEVNGQTYMLNKLTNKMYNYSDNKIGNIYGIYNPNNNKVKIIKNIQCTC